MGVGVTRTMCVNCASVLSSSLVSLPLPTTDLCVHQHSSISACVSYVHFICVSQIKYERGCKQQLQDKCF